MVSNGGKTNYIKIALCILVVLISIAAVIPCHAEDAKKVKSPKHIILVSVDGLNAEAYSSLDKESLRYLALDGVSTERCLAVKSDTIEAGEASLLTGCLPEEHTHYTTSDKVRAESLLDVFDKAKRSILVVDSSGGKLRAFARGTKEYVKYDAALSDLEVMKKATELFLSQKPYFTYIYLNDCRNMGVSDQEYYRALKNLDLGIGRLMKTLQDQGIYKDTMLIVVSSRSSSNSDMVPLIMRGPGIKQKSSINGAGVIDLAPTICVSAGLERPYSSTGLVMWNAFSTDKELSEQELLANRVEELQNDRLKVWKRFYEMVKERDRYSHQIEEIKEEREDFFNFAGEKERTIAELKANLVRERSLAAGVVLFLAIGYFVEYRWLKKKFLLFK